MIDQGHHHRQAQSLILGQRRVDSPSIMFPNLTRRLAQVAKPQIEQAAANATAVTPPAAASPYKLKKVWPPDFKSMTPQQQLRFEKKYKRRLKLKMERPRWNKFVKLAQLVTTTCMAFCSALTSIHLLFIADAYFFQLLSVTWCFLWIGRMSPPLSSQ
jgi:hypothetical protein